MNIVLPDASTRFILYQRSEHLRFTHTKLYQWFRSATGVQAIRPIAFLEARLRKEAIQSAYQEDIAQEFETLVPHLPERCNGLLDIGCGLGAINLFFHQHFGPSETRDYYLLDRNDVRSKLGYGFKKESEFYNSLELTQEILSTNGIEPSSIHLLEVPCSLEERIPKPVDLVISLISWGFHYPMDTYLDDVEDLLSDKGRVILDIRAGTEGLAQLRSRLPNVETILEDKKRIRVVARR